MFFDDRLATVLRQRVSSEAGRRTQFRQLLDILGNRRRTDEEGRDHSLLAAAWLRMDALADVIPAEDRARMVREPGWRLRSAELTAHLADFEPEVAAAALTRAELSAQDWTALIPRLPLRARGFLRLRRDLPLDAEALLERLGIHDRGLPRPGDQAADAQGGAMQEPAAPAGVRPERDATPPGQTLPETARPEPEPEPEPGPEPEADPARSEISALVERIARFRRERETTPAERDPAPGLPLDLPDEEPRGERPVAAFGFAADSAGRIEWAEPEVAPMVIGARLVRRRALLGTGEESALERAFARRQPIAHGAAALSGAPAISGEWVVDARPRFTDDGVFAGYVGRFRRPVETPARPTAAAREADRIRQLLHELRTPVTAVQGYAEVIQQQLFGPAPHEYRALAAAIAADAARILAGFAELDRLARLETGTQDIARGHADLAAAATRTANQLAQVLAPRLSGIEFDPPADRPVEVTLDPDELDALLWRLLATLGGGCAAGEMLTASLAPAFAHDARQGEAGPVGVARLTCEIPAQLLAEEDVFAAEARPASSAINAGLFGAGFALRLARAEARAAGGDLVRRDEELVLTLPLVSEAGEAEPDPREETGGKVS
ncbi:histidine kinase dimerization/phospho-acceptor domain-containing protein [Erythrobacter sp.]|uniref:histidine kinase dimerization/phospho-acceptor domain-containing protein n=1 Tax=Erythrobacter sp. TaxID=1042 RepID=UPI001425D86C|nr:histidine kinase dimerization/phospho-acceptor domain-containing protein [Erythrobacter sp.]QIQ86564.1 MAG: sensor histidine kinase [Erythrobacter sp.]